MFEATRALGENARDPVVSPDGRQIACAWGKMGTEAVAVVAVDDLLANRPRARVIVPGRYISPPEATGSQAALVGIASPAWSPNGAMLAFAGGLMTTRLVTAENCVVGADGSNLRQVTSLGPSHVRLQPCFAPDGKQLVFTALTGGFGPIKPEHLAFVQFTADLYRVNLDGFGLTRLTNDGISSEPAWGP